ncbi:hypothetical protein [Bradyrhizobium sp.]|uniref:hypothetical protein n=1 Tax=Bradyrhizobium sp. TaxID=376 RepID=UPI001D333B6E|nr:hypothetical protein [Bradyrhizobium sp.]MBI5322312.1 hypothetical protein [Bradyrhizobium sp.]
MRLFSLLPTTILAATAALLGASAQAGPLPTNVAAMKSMVEKDTIEVRYRGVGRGVAYRGGRLAYRGGLGYRRLGYGGLAAGAIVAGTVARRAYYGDGYYGGGYPSYGYVEPGYGYDGGYGYAPAPYGYGGGYVVRRYYGW